MHGRYDSVGDREREEPSTSILETSTVGDRRKSEETMGGGEESEVDAEIRFTTSEGRNTTHAILSLEGQGASVHSEEPQRVTDDDGRMKPSKGMCGTKDNAAGRRDRRNKSSAIGMSRESCLGKRRRCVENGGSHTVKRKRSIPESLQGQAGQESASRDEAVTRAATDPDTEVGMTVCFIARDHGKQGRNKEHVMGSPTLKPTILDVSWNALACNQPNLL